MTDAEFVVMEHVRKTPVMFCNKPLMVGNEPLMVGNEPLMVVTEIKVMRISVCEPTFQRGEFCNG